MAATVADAVNILLVDDRPENLLALEAVLGGLGQHLVRARSGAEALKCLLQREYAVILLDVQMPGMDGFETAELIRQRDRSRHTPIIFLTAISTSPTFVSRGYAAGAVDYMAKPLVPEILRAKVAVFVDLFSKSAQVNRLNDDLQRRAAELHAVNQALESDIAARKRAEAALGESEERYRRLVELSPDTIAVHSGGTFTYINPAGVQLIGAASTAEIVGEPVAAFVHPDCPDIFEAPPQQPQGGGQRAAPVEQRLVRRGGRVIDVEVTGIPVVYGGNPATQVVIRDITERKRVEEALRAGEALRASEGRLALQYAVTTVLADAATLGEAAPQVLRTICDRLGWDIGAFWSVGRQEEVLRCRALWHEPSPALAGLAALSRQITLPPGVGLPGRVWASGAPSWAANLATDDTSLRAQMAADEGLAATFCCPIPIGKAVHSVMEFFSRDPEPLDPDLVGALVTIGVLIGQFIERRQAEAEILAELKRAELLLETSNALNRGLTGGDVSQMIVESAARLVGGGAVALWTAADAGAEQLRVTAASPGLEWSLGMQAAHGEDLVGPLCGPVTPFARQPVGASIAAPLSVDDSLLAVVTVYHHEPRSYSAPERAILRAFANQAASVLRSAQLRDELATSLHDLDARTAALEAKTREQEAFIYTVSHDLQAPLVSLQGMVGILVEDYADAFAGDARLYLDRIAANAGKMQALLSDLLEISRVGRVEVEYHPVDLGAVVDGVTEQLGHTLAARGAAVRVDGRLPTVSANRTRMAQVLTNLIDNAIKYTPPDRAPLVQLRAAERHDCWEIAVADNGVGIPAAFREKVLGLFQRLPSGKALNPQGSGVGLAIVARIVETHGGTLRVESEEGVGTTFRFTLPKRGGETYRQQIGASARQQASKQGGSA